MTQIGLSWLCGPLLLGLTLIFAFFGSRSGFRFVRRIREAQAAGAFTDPSFVAQTLRYRPVTALAAAGSLIAISSMGLLVLDRLFGVTTLPPVLLLVAAFLALLPGGVFGLLMTHAMARRL